MSTTQGFGDPGRPSVSRQPAPMAMTAALLAGLLREDERYRRAWRARMDRTPTGEVQQSAVARVLAEHLWETGQVEERDEALPRRLKDTVARALSGRHLSPRTLRLFTDAFGMRPVHRALLWAYLEREAGRERDPSPAQGQVATSGTAPTADAPASWETVSLHATHTVDDHGGLRQRMLHVVRALAPLPSVSVPLGVPAESVVARQGARVARPPGDHHDAHAAALALPEPLRAEDTALLEYDVVPAGGAPATRAPTLLPCLSPGATAVVQVRFHPHRLPREVWWWQDGDGPAHDGPPPVRVRLGPGADAHRVLTAAQEEVTVPRRVVGFGWSW